MQSMALVILGSPDAIQTFIEAFQARCPFINITTPTVMNEAKTLGFCERTMRMHIFFRHSVTEEEIEHVLQSAERVQVGCTSCA